MELSIEKKARCQKTEDIFRGRREWVSKSGRETGKRGCWKTEGEGGIGRTNCCVVRTINGRKLSNIPNHPSVKTNGRCYGDTGLLNPFNANTVVYDLLYALRQLSMSHNHGTFLWRFLMDPWWKTGHWGGVMCLCVCTCLLVH